MPLLQLDGMEAAGALQISSSETAEMDIRSLWKPVVGA